MLARRLRQLRPNSAKGPCVVDYIVVDLLYSLLHSMLYKKQIHNESKQVELVRCWDRCEVVSGGQRGVGKLGRSKLGLGNVSLGKLV